MEVDIQVERAAEAFEQRHRAGMGQIAALTAQRDKDPAVRREAESRPEVHEVRIDGILVKSNFIVLPAFMPELGVH